MDEALTQRDHEFNQLKEASRARDEEFKQWKEASRAREAEINKLTRANEVYLRIFLSQIREKLIKQSGQKNPEKWNTFLQWAKNHLDQFTPTLTAKDLDQTALGPGTWHLRGNLAAHSDFYAVMIADYLMTLQSGERESFARLFIYLYGIPLESYVVSM